MYIFACKFSAFTKLPIVRVMNDENSYESVIFRLIEFMLLGKIGQDSSEFMGIHALNSRITMIGAHETSNVIILHSKSRCLVKSKKGKLKLILILFSCADDDLKYKAIGQ